MKTTDYYKGFLLAFIIIGYSCNYSNNEYKKIVKQEHPDQIAKRLYHTLIEYWDKGDYNSASIYYDSLKEYYQEHTYFKLACNHILKGEEVEIKTYSVIGEENILYSEPSSRSQKVINQKASSTFNKTMYCQIDRSTKVKILESKNGWFKVQVVEPNWLRNSHIGWVKESVIKVNEIKDSNYIEWRSPKTEEFAPIGRVLVSNNIEGCGEYKVFQKSSNQYLIACTRDGKNWNYYEIRLNSNIITNLKDSSINSPY